jgi:hypothetical protein
MWKLDKTAEYTGNLSNDFFHYLDRLQLDPQSYKLLPKPSPSEREREGTKRVIAYCQAVSDASLNHEDRVKLEYEFAADMKERFNFTYKPILISEVSE